MASDVAQLVERHGPGDDGGPRSERISRLSLLMAVLTVLGWLIGVAAGVGAHGRTTEAPAGTASDAAVRSRPAAGLDSRSVIAVRGSGLADPFVLTVDGVSYAYGTNLPGAANIPVLRSTDLRTWHRTGDALPRLPGWAQETGFTTWAPAVAQVPGGFVLYYATRVRRSGIQCVSTAFAPRPDGPFTDSSTAPLICQRGQGGSIDPSPYLAGHTRYLTWKSEGIRPGTHPTIWAQALSPDGRRLAGRAPVRLLTATQPWQDGIVEGPAMLARNGTFWLFYSAGRWHSPDYATGAAACASALGPCRPAPGPLLATGADGVGLGGAEPFQSADHRWWLALHSWPQGPPGACPSGDRELVLAPLSRSGQPMVVPRPDVRPGQVR